MPDLAIKTQENANDQKVWVGYRALAAAVGPLAAESRWGDVGALEERVKNGDYGTVASILIMDGGKVVYEGYFNGADADTLHNTRSVTKTMTGMAVGAASDEGKLRIDEPAAKYFTDIAPFENPDPRKLAMTLEDMITMSGVLDCNDDDRFSRGNESRMHNIEDWPSFFWDLPIRGYPSWCKRLMRRNMAGSSLTVLRALIWPARLWSGD